MQFQTKYKTDGIPSDLKRMIDIIEKSMGIKVKNTAVLVDDKAVQFMFYDSFEWMFSIEDRYGTFAVSMAYGNGFRGVSKLLGKKMTLDCDEGSIQDNLKIIDEYCRLRLPDKFLESYHEMYEK